MRTASVRACWVMALLAAVAGRAQAAEPKVAEPKVAEPKVVDALQPLRLTRPELSGEIGRRIEDLIYKNYMVLDLERGFLDPFRQRPPAKEWRYIGVGKVIDAASMFAAYTGDPEVGRRTARLIDALMKTRDPDGYLGHMKAEPEGRQNYRNWILHDQEYALLGLVDHWRYCGDEKSLQYARQLGDYILATFPKNPKPEDVCTAGLPEAMLTLYGCTGDPRYLRFAADTRHGSQWEVECSSLRDWEQTFENPKRSHVYVMLARCYSQTMLYRWEPADRLLKMSRFMLHELVRKDGGLLITGSGSDGERFAYTQNGRGAISESCVTAYLIRWLGSLMRLEGDLRYGDVMERTIYNALFAAQDPAGRRLRYFTPFAGPRDYFGQDGFCCPGNYRRIVAELPEMVYYRTADGGVAVNLFTESKKAVDLGGGRSVTIQQQTDYPTSGLVKITVTPPAAMEFPLRLRIPRWCPKARLAINGESPREVSPGEKHHEIRRTWKPGDIVTLDMPMPWRLIRGRKLQDQRAALVRGPVVYCIGTAGNAELLKKCKEPGDLTIDPGSLGKPMADTSVRPGGLKVLAKAWPAGSPAKDAAPLDVVLTEFVDPSGIATYFHVPDLTKAVDDELTSQPRAAAETKTTGAVNYGRPFEPPTRPAFIALPPGAVEPGGWLRDWCLAARDGYTGHMDEVDVEFRRAWAVDHTMTGDRLNWPRGAWPYEGGGYWFDGLARLGYVLHDDALIEQAKRRFDVVVSRMNPNGILFLWWLNKNSPDDAKAITCDGGWPIWACGLLGRGMSAYHAGSGDKRVLEALEAAYAGDRNWLHLPGGMSSVWPALQTYTWTGNKQIAEALGELFSKDGPKPGVSPGAWGRYRRMPKQEPGAEASEHGVMFLESTTPWALGYLWSGSREFLDVTLAWHDLLEREAMQPSGVPVMDEFWGPTGAFRATETCDVAGYLWSQIVLLSVSGQGRMADRAERAMFNAGPATVARDFKTHVYFQSPNRVVDGSPPCPHGPGASGCSYKATHMPLCCTAALNRIVPNYVMHMWMATYDNGLAATHYGPCKVSALAGDRVPVEIVCRTDYPFDEVIEMTVNPAREATFPLLLRIPGWCKSAELSVNGSGVKPVPNANGFVRVERLWKPGDAVRLRFPMSASVTTGRDRNAQGAPYASVSYGPLLFALPIPDTQGPNVPDPAAKWRYALDVQGEKLQRDMVVERQAMPAKWDWPLASPLKLRANAVAIDWNPEPKAPRLPSGPIAKGGPPERITLVPYGCTKFRVSMFPVTGPGPKGR